MLSDEQRTDLLSRIADVITNAHHPEVGTAPDENVYLTLGDLEDLFALTAPARRPSVEEVARDAIVGVSSDYMTSAEHHPDYVLIPNGRFQALADAEKQILTLPARKPEGWVLVPREPTEEMLRSAVGWREYDSREGLSGEPDMFERAYYAMLSALPTKGESHD